jgi:hypothetical protein
LTRAVTPVTGCDLMGQGIKQTNKASWSAANK